MLAAHCAGFALPNLHSEWMRGRVPIIACPKLEDNEVLVEKLTAIIKHGGIAGITVLRMSVPCCGGLERLVHRAIEAGDAETGVTIMQMDVGLDTGDMLLTVREPIHADDSTGSLHDRLAAQGAQAMVAALAQLDALSPQPQPAEGVTYAEKIGKAEAQLDWSLPAEVLHRKIRAFNPFPGASTLAGGEALKIWQAQLADGAGAPGDVLAADADGVRIACGSGALLATQLQAAGGKRLAAREFLAGHSLPARLGE